MMTLDAAWWTLGAAAVLGLLALLLAGLRRRRQASARRCECAARMDGKVAVVTGANSGIGKETARGLAGRGARVIMACPDLQMANEARDDIVASTGNSDVQVMFLDLLALRSVREFAGQVMQSESRLDVLVNNAGVLTLPHEYTEDGLVKAMQVNFFGPMLLTCLLLDMLKRTRSGRVLFVSSSAHAWRPLDIDNMNCEKKYHRTAIYGDSKLCIILAARYMAEKLQGTGVTVNSLHPGGAGTDIYKNYSSNACFLITITAVTPLATYFLIKTAWEGAQTSIHLAVSEEGGRVTGKYFVNLREDDVADHAKRPGLGEQVWARTETYIKLADHERPWPSSSSTPQHVTISVPHK